MSTLHKLSPAILILVAGACAPKAERANIAPVVATELRDFPETKLELGLSTVVYFKDGSTPADMAVVMGQSGKLDVLRLKRRALKADPEIPRVQEIRDVAARVKEIDRSLAELGTQRTKLTADSAQELATLAEEARALGVEKQTLLDTKAGLEQEKLTATDPARLLEIDNALAQLAPNLEDVEARIVRNGKKVTRCQDDLQLALADMETQEKDLRRERALKETDQQLLLISDSEGLSSSEKQRIWTKALELDSIQDLMVQSFVEISRHIVGEIRKQAQFTFDIQADGTMSARIAKFNRALVESVQENCATSDAPSVEWALHEGGLASDAEVPCRVEPLAAGTRMYEPHGGKLAFRLALADGSSYEIRAERALYAVGDQIGGRIFTGDVKANLASTAANGEAIVRKGLIKLMDKDLE